MNLSQPSTHPINHLESTLRPFLAAQDKQWLMDQIIRLTLHPHQPPVPDPQQAQARASARAERITRLRGLALNPPVLLEFLKENQSLDRTRLIGEGYLQESAPPKGTGLIGEAHRTEKGNQLLLQCKDLLFGLLFGDECTNTQFERTQRELLTLALPRPKAHALDFMQAATEFSAAGTWQDPHSVSSDSRADNVILEIEYGEVEGELIGDGIVRCLSLINHLEVNEQILYARMINVEQSTLI